MAVNNSLFESESPLPFNHLDDTAFNAVLYEFEHGPLNFDLGPVYTIPDCIGA